jgi:hypothetical protein
MQKDAGRRRKSRKPCKGLTQRILACYAMGAQLLFKSKEIYSKTGEVENWLFNER